MEKATNMKKKRQTTVPEAFASLLFLILAVMIGSIWGGTGVGTPLALSIGFVSIIAGKCGYGWNDIKEAMCEKVTSILDIFFILLGVGFLIATWMFSGTVPTLISYMIRIISAKYVIVLTFILCAILSLIIGTAWGTAGTIGIVMIGLGMTLGVNMPAMAAAVAGGAHVGQILSPMADMVNLTAALGKKDPIETAKRSAYFVIPAMITTIIIYLAIGFFSNQQTASMEEITIIVDSISSIFNVCIWALIPLFILLILSILRKPILPTLFISGLSAIAIGTIINGFPLMAGISVAHEGFTLAKMGVDTSAVNPIVLSLVERGGMSSFGSVFITLFLALGYAGIMVKIGALEVIVRTLFGHANHPITLSISTCLIGIITAAGTSNSYLTLLMPVELLGSKYEKNGWNLLNAACISGSVGALIMLLIPWSTTAIYFAGVTGVPTMSALPYNVFIYGCPIFAVLTSVIRLGWSKN
ncbi:hypothetical protein LI031_24525 [Enterocloster citroniae]|uniref:Na+/H+ antiporter NhaC family protein n=1 Tax=Enterocloster citroniae TaxID=358743 RepID=UPI001D063F66|nr:Na+/H+ antiporter NhaC family protein [Enterocloster citroniae]MCB7067031.1 hypothetical protein [Enterocloster citroniae]